jgi:NitT/TauT family transport system substrate-binding protein
MQAYTNDVIVPIDSPLKTIADIKGKRIGLFGGPTAATSWLFRLQAVKFFGFDPMKESKIHYGAPPLLIGMMERGDLDAVLTLDPQITQLLETGKFRSIGNIGDIWRAKSGQNPMLVSVTVNEPWAKANPAKVFGEAGDVPKQIPDGTFDMSYAR